MPMTMSVLDAALTLARAYPGGARALGARMGKSNLADELNPNVRTAKLGLEDAVTMQLFAGAYGVLYAMAAELNHLPPVPMPEGLAVVDVQCMRTLSELVKESADVVSATVEALGDDDVSDNELARFDKEWGELIAKGQALRQQMAAKNAKGKKARAA